MDYLKVKVSFSFSMFETRRLVKLGKLSGEDLDLSSWWSILDSKIALFGGTKLEADMDALCLS